MHGIDRSTVDALLDYRWPGNVRELRNVIDRALVVATGQTITREDLPQRILRDASLLEDENLPFRDRIRQIEIQLMSEALRRSRGNQSEAAKRLNMPRRTFVSKLREYGLRDIDD